ncbi:helix-turn-helix domain-containing protein [Thioclava kandeliae]|uniref:Helix-turn-helix domain-containing protein n=1 Tax=Thioclava kandeliae TaxID=3070818 RepID=A0ABV1SE13_9RHOB
MSFIFQTDDCLTGDKFDYWQNMISQHHVAVVSPFEGADGFRGWMKINDWGGLQFSDTKFSPIAYSHGVNEMRHSAHDDFFCVLALDSGGSFVNNTSAFEFKANDIVVYDTDQIYSIRFPKDARTITLRIPRPLMTSRIKDADRQFAIHLDGQNPLARLAAGLMLNVNDLTDLPDAQKCREAEGPILDILSLAVRDLHEDQSRPSAGQAAMLSRIKRELMGQLDDSDLSVVGIAMANGISPRTLNRLFASEGTTVMRWVWSQRLAASYRAMSDGSVRQVTEAAFRFGFKDSSHFARAFKKEFNITPSQLLTRC